jgi:hypothetical protein
MRLDQRLPKGEEKGMRRLKGGHQKRAEAIGDTSKRGEIINIKNECNKITMMDANGSFYFGERF